MILLKRKKVIPEFKNRQEMAEWFDTHDMTEYDFKPVKVKFMLEEPKKEKITVTIRKEVKNVLENIAKTKGLTVPNLMQLWITEKLQTMQR